MRPAGQPSSRRSTPAGPTILSPGNTHHPQGSRLIGRYQSECHFARTRALVTWDGIIFRWAYQFPQSRPPGADMQANAAPSPDRTDHHWIPRVRGSWSRTILGVGADSEMTVTAISNVPSAAARNGHRQPGRSAGGSNANLGIQPTIGPPGWPVAWSSRANLILRPLEQEPRIQDAMEPY